MVFKLTINQAVDYMAWGFMSFMRGVDITGAIGRVGSKVEPVLGPEILGPSFRISRLRKVKVYFTPC